MTRRTTMTGLTSHAHHRATRLEGVKIRNDKGLRGNDMVWLLAVIIISVATKVDTAWQHRRIGHKRLRDDRSQPQLTIPACRDWPAGRRGRIADSDMVVAASGRSAGYRVLRP